MLTSLCQDESKAACGAAVEDTSIFPGSNMLGRSIRDQRTEIKRGVGRTEIRAKFVGTYMQLTLDG